MKTIQDQQHQNSITTISNFFYYSQKLLLLLLSPLLLSLLLFQFLPRLLTQDVDVDFSECGTLLVGGLQSVLPCVVQAHVTDVEKGTPCSHQGV